MNDSPQIAARRRLREELARLDAELAALGIARPPGATVSEHLDALSRADALADIDFQQAKAAAALVYAPDASPQGLQDAAGHLAALVRALVQARERAAAAGRPWPNEETLYPHRAAHSRPDPLPEETAAPEEPWFPESEPSPQLVEPDRPRRRLRGRDIATLAAAALVVGVTAAIAFWIRGPWQEGVQAQLEVATPPSQLESSVRQHPDNAQLRLQLANEYLEKGDFAAAARQYLDLLKMLPKNAEALNNLAWVLLTNPKPAYRNPRRALQLAQRAVALSGQSEPHILDTLAVAYFQLGDKRKAIEIIERILKMKKLSRQERAFYERRLRKMRKEKPPGEWGPDS